MSLPMQSNVIVGKHLNVECNVVTATKALVDDLLARNTHNRSVSEIAVDRLVHDLEEGRWEVTNNAIAVSEDDVLLDGQHRLLALKKAGYPAVEFLLAWGFRRTAIAAIDVGKRRHNHDTIKLLLDRDASKSFVAACFAIANYQWKESGWVRNRYEVEVRGTDLASVVEQYTAANSIFATASNKHSFFRCGVRAALTVFAHAYPIDASHFIRLIEFGEGLTRLMPAYWLRENCIRKSRGGKATLIEDWSCAVRCINDFVLRRQIGVWRASMCQDWCLQIKERMPNVDTH